MSASFIPDNSENGRKIKIINILLMHTHTCAHAHTYKTLIFMHLFHIKMRARGICVWRNGSGHEVGVKLGVRIVRTIDILLFKIF